MHSYRKALPRVAAILLFWALAIITAPRKSIGLPQLQSPISPVITPTSATYLPMVVREGTTHCTDTYLPLVIR
jgi:hypothetical protein